MASLGIIVIYQPRLGQFIPHQPFWRAAITLDVIISDLLELKTLHLLHSNLLLFIEADEGGSFIWRLTMQLCLTWSWGVK